MLSQTRLTLLLAGALASTLVGACSIQVTRMSTISGGGIFGDLENVDAKTVKISVSENMFKEIHIKSDGKIEVKPSQNKETEIEADVLIFPAPTDSNAVPAPVENILVESVIGQSKMSEVNGRSVVHYDTSGSEIPFCEVAPNALGLTYTGVHESSTTSGGQTVRKKQITVSKETIDRNKDKGRCVWGVTVRPGLGTQSEIIINGTLAHSPNMTSDEVEEAMDLFISSSDKEDYVVSHLLSNRDRIECADLVLIENLSTSDRDDAIESVLKAGTPNISVSCAASVLEMMSTSDRDDVVAVFAHQTHGTLSASELVSVLDQLSTSDRDDSLEILAKRGRIRNLKSSSAPDVLETLSTFDRMDGLEALVPHMVINPKDIRRILSVLPSSDKDDALELLL